MELLRRTERAPARDDDLGGGELGPLGLAEFGPDEGGKARIGAPPETASMVPLPPSRAAFSKAVVRTVITFLASEDFTVAIALPA